MKFSRQFCYLSYDWYCKNCIAPETHIIPWKASEDFDLKPYTVSAAIAAELEANYDRPILEIPTDSIMIKKYPSFSNFLLLRLELHLLYDSICRPSIVADLMPGYLNLLLKQVLLSVKNMTEIKAGTLQEKLKTWLVQFKEHFEGCEHCIPKGRLCSTCKDPNNRVFVFEVMTTKVCKQCHHIYHKTCWAVKNCSYCNSG